MIEWEECHEKPKVICKKTLVGDPGIQNKTHLGHFVQCSGPPAHTGVCSQEEMSGYRGHKLCLLCHAMSYYVMLCHVMQCYHMFFFNFCLFKM